MQLTRYKLGDLIVQRREKNEGFDVPIRGVSRDGFIKPKQQDADTSIYNVFYRNDFVFNPARMELNSIALNLEFDKALCSSLYEVFYVNDENIVLPEFLNLHIKRDEFARHCEFIGAGSAREYCRVAQISEFDIELPPIDVQKKIVEANRLLVKRIETNKKLIATLEQTAQALYKHTFVDNIDPNNLPAGWRMGTVGELFELQRGFDLPTQERVEGKYPIYASTGVAEFHNEFRVKAPGIVTGRSGSIGEIFYVDEDFWPLNTTLWVKEFKKSTPFYAYYCLKNINLESLAQGSAVPTLNRKDVHSQEFLVPDEETLLDFERQQVIIFNHKKNLMKEIHSVNQLQTLLLSKMGS